MIGNTEEWVEDHFHYSYNGIPSDGKPWVESDSYRWLKRLLGFHQNDLLKTRVIRGGSYLTSYFDLSSYYRSGRLATYTDNSIGFRIARDI